MEKKSIEEIIEESHIYQTACLSPEVHSESDVIDLIEAPP